MSRSVYRAALVAPLFWGLTACSTPDREQPGPGSIRVVDDTGHEIVLSDPASRVVSLVPTLTETIFALGRGDRLVGRTRWGQHPPEARVVPSVGDGIRPDPEAILEREPDLVLMFAGPDNRASLQRLRALQLNVIAVRHNDLADLTRNIERLGKLTGAEEAADSLASRIRSGLSGIARSARGAGEPVRVYYHLGGDPPYTIGGGSYLDSLITIAGGRNVFADLEQPSPIVGLEAVIGRRPECVIVGMFGLDRAEALSRLRDASTWSAVPAIEQGRVVTVDVDLVHRLGPRVVEATAELRGAVDRCRELMGGAGS